MQIETAAEPLLREILASLETPHSLPEGGVSFDLARQVARALALADAPQAGPLGAALTPLLRALERRLREDWALQQIRLQKTVFEEQQLRALLRAERAAGVTERLTGPGRALGVLFARALEALPPENRPGLLDEAFYLATNPDVAAAGVNATAHYLSSGATEGRMPADLVAPCPEGFAERPLTLEALFRASKPVFPEGLSEGLRGAALALLGREMPRVSVIVPSWNRAQTVASAIASALLQSYAPSEVILVDDGSHDATLALLAANFAEPIADGRLIVIETPHAGVSAARNAGLTRATGEIVAYLDSDNSWHSDHLLYACAGLLQSGAESLYTAVCRHNIDDGWSDILFAPFDRARLERENFIDLNGFVHRHGLFERCGGFDTGLTRLVDWDLVLRYSAEAAPGALPVITAHNVLCRTVLNNITGSEPLEPNLARIRAKLPPIAEGTE
ncbi:glycosyltransferase family 2 protein [Rhodobacter maris]|uniref:Glycosyl transferase family 2 n=1 Tax=Rhodobacter maris TaxID=446682 RepID=A0A285SGC5_9RHOB|nr:glycosyltransferase family A protein [Rhodobacter maris]SOC06926.1 glycosyl transferase family 2 [Rhodobacter maris]